LRVETVAHVSPEKNFIEPSSKYVKRKLFWLQLQVTISKIYLVTKNMRTEVAFEIKLLFKLEQK
jgi:hypothetical protein